MADREFFEQLFAINVCMNVCIERRIEAGEVVTGDRRYGWILFPLGRGVENPLWHGLEVERS